MRTELLQQFEQLVTAYQQDVINFHYRLVGSRFEAENLAQDTFLKAYKKIGTLKEPSKARSWLFSIAKNTAMDFFRKRHERPLPLDPALLESYARNGNGLSVDYEYDRSLMRDELSREVRKCLKYLNGTDRLMVKLLYFEGFSYAEIAQLLNMNQNTLKSRLHRARKTLMQAIQQNELLHEVAARYE